MKGDVQDDSGAVFFDARKDRLSEDRKRLFDLLLEKRKKNEPGASASDGNSDNQAAQGEPKTESTESPHKANSPNNAPPKGPLSPRLVRMKVGGKSPPFFCVHALLGSVFPYQRLAIHMPDELPFYGIQAAGVDGKDKPSEDVGEMAEAYLKAISEIQPEGPIYVGGYSFGGFVAYEMARQAMQKGRTIGLLAVFGVGAPMTALLPWLRDPSNNPPQNPAWEEQWRFAQQYFEDFQKLIKNAMLAEMGPNAAPTFEAPDMDVWLTPMQRVTFANLRAQNKFVPEPSIGSLDLFITQDQEVLLQADPTMGWKTVLAGPVRTHSVGGNHLNMFEEPQVKRLAETLETRLKEEQAKHGP